MTRDTYYSLQFHYPINEKDKILKYTACRSLSGFREEGLLESLLILLKSLFAELGLIFTVEYISYTIHRISTSICTRPSVLVNKNIILFMLRYTIPYCIINDLYHYHLTSHFSHTFTWRN